MDKTPPRIAPVAAPYDPDLQAIFDAVMRGKPPLVLFTTLARDARLFGKFRNGSLLDRGLLTLRQREVVINRVTAQCGSEYEWGVHVAIYGEKSGFTPQQVRAFVQGSADDACWSDEDKVLVRLCDSLHANCNIDDALWADLRTRFSEEAILELILLAGFYRTVSYLTNSLKLPLEDFGARFPG